METFTEHLKHLLVRLVVIAKTHPVTGETEAWLRDLLSIPQLTVGFSSARVG